MISHEERRSVLTTQHQRLRDLMVQVREAAVRLLSQQEGAGDPEPLRGLVTTFRSELEAHLATEEALLGPVLERLDAWGPVRLELMKAEHAHQRAVLDALRTERAVAASPHLLARRVLSLLDDVVADMEAEERDLLDARVLRDDLIVLDASDA